MCSSRLDPTGGSLTARAFGDKLTDLDLDFSTRSRVELVDRVLANCLASSATPNDGANLRDWTLDARLRALITVTVVTCGTRFEFWLECNRDGCRQRSELQVDLAELARTTSTASGPLVSEPEAGHVVNLRLPTGSDQAHWFETEATQGTIARDLVTEVNGEAPRPDWALPEQWLPLLAEVLSNADPLSDLELRTACAHCGADLAVELDLEAELLRRLSALQPNLLDEIHCLARAYHWSEAQIMALPRWRRADYLRRIAAGGWS